VEKVNIVKKVETALQHVRSLTKCAISVVMLSEVYENIIILKGLFENNKWYTVKVEMDDQLSLKRIVIEV